MYKINLLEKKYFNQHKNKYNRCSKQLEGFILNEIVYNFDYINNGFNVSDYLKVDRMWCNEIN